MTKSTGTTEAAGPVAQTTALAVSRLLLVDGHCYAYRAFHAIQSLHAPDGSPTNAIFGFVKMLKRLMDSQRPSHAAVVWDGGLSPERTAALAQYKAQRPEMPEALQSQMDDLAGFVTASGITSLCEDGVEADDLIASLAGRAVASGAEVVIASSDKDFMQLVSPRVSLVNPQDREETRWDEQRVREQTGVAAGQIIDRLSLMGDAVDNIPGVPGVGSKTASRLLQEFGSVDELYSNLERVPAQKLRSNLLDSAADVRRNQQLIRLKNNLPVRVDLADLAVRAPENAVLAALCQRWGFRSLLREVAVAAAGQNELFALTA